MTEAQNVESVEQLNTEVEQKAKPSSLQYLEKNARVTAAAVIGAIILISYLGYLSRDQALVFVGIIVLILAAMSWAEKDSRLKDKESRSILLTQLLELQQTGLGGLGAMDRIEIEPYSVLRFVGNHKQPWKRETGFKVIKPSGKILHFSAEQSAYAPGDLLSIKGRPFGFQGHGSADVVYVKVNDYGNYGGSYGGQRR